MLEKYDKLAITPELVDKLSPEELKERVKERDELIKEMSDAEIEELLNRPIPSQYKAKIKQIRGE